MKRDNGMRKRPTIVTMNLPINRCIARTKQNFGGNGFSYKIMRFVYTAIESALSNVFVHSHTRSADSPNSISWRTLCSFATLAGHQISHIHAYLRQTLGQFVLMQHQHQPAVHHTQNHSKATFYSDTHR